MSNLALVKPKAKTITLSDGVEREIRFTLNALAELEERYGTVQAAFDALEQNSIKAVRCVLWAGLMHVADAPTEQQVGDMIDLGNLNSIVETMAEALTKDMPKEDSVSPNV